jgi:anti-anti-sigma factor
MGEGAPEQLEIDVQRGPDGPVVVVRGELDAYTLDRLSACLARVVPEAAGRELVLDVRDLSLIDSLGLGLLMRTQQELEARGGGRMVLVAPTGAVRYVLEVTGVQDVFEIR